MEDNHTVVSGGGGSLLDYKFYCFNEVPKFLYISEGLENHATAKVSFLTLDWQFADFRRSDYKPFTTLLQKPECFEEMLEICKKLSKGTKFLRVDLYVIQNRIYFSELTFFLVVDLCHVHTKMT